MGFTGNAKTEKSEIQRESQRNRRHPYDGGGKQRKKKRSSRCIKKASSSRQRRSNTFRKKRKKSLSLFAGRKKKGGCRERKNRVYFLQRALSSWNQKEIRAGEKKGKKQL